MDLHVKERFLTLWNRYFEGADLPITCFYTPEAGAVEVVPPPTGHRCLIADLSRVRAGHPLCFEAASVGCGGGQRYLGFTQALAPNFEYFLSCGIPGKMEGERYKKSPELVRELLRQAPTFQAPDRFIVFKRWDHLEANDEPEVVIFFAPPDVLSGLFTLANFEEADPYGVIAPFSAGCGSIVQYPYLEKDSERPRAVLGMFDVSARPYVPAGVLSFAVPINKFLRMVEDMEQSFLITASWEKVQQRMRRDG